jgi:hypothetical protein
VTRKWCIFHGVNTEPSCSGYRPARSSVLRSPVARKKATRDMPDCVCEHGCKKHAATLEADGMGFKVVRGRCSLCPCAGYVGAVTRKQASALLRKSAPARTKRKMMPKCKHCAHPAAKHHCHYGPKCCYVGRDGRRQHGDARGRGPECQRCAACPGYEPAIGIRQKRRTPAAALKLRCDNLWAAIVHARPEMCEVQQYHQHTCNGGYQAMHGVPRTFAATRWLPINGFKGCAGTHKFFTDRPEAWSALLLEAWGLETFRELWSKARAMQPVDMSATYAALRAEAAARGIE